MLLGQLDSKSINDFLSISLESGIESTLPIDDNKSKWWLTDQQFLLQFVHIELGVTRVDGKVDGLERFKITD